MHASAARARHGGSVFEAVRNLCQMWFRKFSEFVVGGAICLGWTLGVHWVCGEPPGGNDFLVWLDSVVGLALAGTFEALTLLSVTAGLAGWACWAVFVGRDFSLKIDNAGAFFLTFIGLPALGVLLGLIFRKRRARALR